MWHTKPSILNREEAEIQLSEELKALLDGCEKGNLIKYKEEINGFFRLFCSYWRHSEPSIQWDKIEPVPSGLLVDHTRLIQPSPETIANQLNRLVVIKLNGGLGTTMRCKGPKSLIPVRNGFTFLDITVHQIVNLNDKYNTHVPLVLMNSFNTEESTRRMLRKYRGLNIKIYTFLQHKYPRIHCESFVPLPSSYEDPKYENWYPPGHGDFYSSFCSSGLNKEFLKKGKEYCFVSNIDNLGAVVDLQTLNFLTQPPTELQPEFLMEVTQKTTSDIKGGTLICYEGRLRLLEIAEVPQDRVDDFKGVKKFRVFNTNNLWMKLSAIDRVVSEGTLNMPVIENTKLIAQGYNVIQLETAIGSAIMDFNDSIAIVVDRSRFLPVKNTADLLLIRSNVYAFNDGVLSMNVRRSIPVAPLIKLGDEFFGSVEEFDRRFQNMPDIRELIHLSVNGNVHFGMNVTLRGNVSIIADQWKQLVIPPGAVLENKILTGCLRIIEQ